MRPLLLTGASGYIGSRVARALDGANVPWRALGGRLAEIERSALDVDVVIHCAGALRSRPDALTSTNRDGTARMLAGLRRRARVVLLSTRSVYAQDGARTVDEAAPTAPFDEYGRSKLAAEDLLRGSVHRGIILRVTGVFGHPERDGVFLDHAVGMAMSGRPIPVADPDRPEDAVAVDWLAGAVVRAATTGDADAGTLHLAGPVRPLSGVVAALGRAVTATTGRPVGTVPLPLPPPTRPLLDARRATSVLGLPPHPEDEEVFAAKARAWRVATAQ